MTYTPNIPQTGQSLGSTRDPIRTNFQQIDAVNSINHESFDTANKGKHKFLQMPEQSTAPTTAADEGGLYTKVGVGPSETNLFFRGESDGKEYQLTKAIQADNAKFGTDTNYEEGPPSLNGGWTFLPGGLVLQWGLINTAASSSTFAVNFPIVFPTNVWNIQVTGTRAASSPGNTDAWVSTSGLSTSGFTIYNNGGHNFKFYWQAIGN